MNANTIHAALTRKSKKGNYRRYIDGNNAVCIWPKWLNHRTCEKLESAGLMTHKTYGPATYAATVYFVQVTK